MTSQQGLVPSLTSSQYETKVLSFLSPINDSKDVTGWLPPMIEFARAGRAMDILKRQGFYATKPDQKRLTKNKNEIDELVRGVNDAIALARIDNADMPSVPVGMSFLDATPIGHMGVDSGIIHAILGIASEAGELIELLLRAFINKGEIDFTNLFEESGDSAWYHSLLISCARRLNVAHRDRWHFEFIWAGNIAKLTARRMQGNDAHVITQTERNKGAEMAAMESGHIMPGVTSIPTGIVWGNEVEIPAGVPAISRDRHIDFSKRIADINILSVMHPEVSNERLYQSWGSMHPESATYLRLQAYGICWMNLLNEIWTEAGGSRALMASVIEYHELIDLLFGWWRCDPDNTRAYDPGFVKFVNAIGERTRLLQAKPPEPLPRLIEMPLRYGIYRLVRDIPGELRAGVELKCLDGHFHMCTLDEKYLFEKRPLGGYPVFAGEWFWSHHRDSLLLVGMGPEAKSIGIEDLEDGTCPGIGDTVWICEHEVFKAKVIGLRHDNIRNILEREYVTIGLDDVPQPTLVDWESVESVWSDKGDAEAAMQVIKARNAADSAKA